jgi:hypothetical protein
MEEVKDVGIALYDLEEALFDLTEYLAGAVLENIDRTKVAKFVHNINEAYVNYAHLVDMAEVVVVE